MKTYKVLKPHWVGHAGFGGAKIERDPKDPETIRLLEGGAIELVETESTPKAEKPEKVPEGG